MQTPIPSLAVSHSSDLLVTSSYLLRQGLLKLLAIKDSDIRILTLEQNRDAIENLQGTATSL